MQSFKIILFAYNPQTNQSNFFPYIPNPLNMHDIIVKLLLILEVISNAYIKIIVGLKVPLTIVKLN